MSCESSSFLLNHQRRLKNTFASDVRKRNFRIRPIECVFRITRKVDKISYELDYRLLQENIQFLFFLVHIYSRGASDDSDIAQASLKKKYLHKFRVSPKLVLLPFRKLICLTDTRCHMSYYPRHKLVSQLQDIPECTRIFLRFPCASRSEKTENTFCCNLRGDNVIETFKLRTSGNCWSL